MGLREVVQEIIAKAAYRRTEARGFRLGHELADWIAAEAEVARMPHIFSAADEPHNRLPDESCTAAAQHPRLDMRPGLQEGHERCTDNVMDLWEFYYYGNGKWTWLNTTPEGYRHSSDAFDSWIEAMADAIQDTFQAGESGIGDIKPSRRSEPRA
jgi:hypothetical protein